MNDSHDHPTEAVTDQLYELTPTYPSAVLEYFHRHSAEVATVDDLEVVTRDLDPPDEDESRVAIHLHHATLPKSARKEFIDYDPRSNTARYRGTPPNFEQGGHAKAFPLPPTLSTHGVWLGK